MFSLVLKLMKKACTVWHWPGLEGNQTARILAILSICRFVLRHYCRERDPKLLLIVNAASLEMRAKIREEDSVHLAQSQHQELFPS
jgi:hypothetical protein